jgi:hypothetical protein
MLLRSYVLGRLDVIPSSFFSPASGETLRRNATQSEYLAMGPSHGCNRGKLAIRGAEEYTHAG